jgi:hypothetical protein
MTIRYDQTGVAMQLSAAIHQAGDTLMDFCLQKPFDASTYRNQLSRVLILLQCDLDSTAHFVADVRTRTPTWMPSISFSTAVADVEEYVAAALNFDTNYLDPEHTPDDIYDGLREFGLEMLTRDHAARVQARIEAIAAGAVDQHRSNIASATAGAADGRH